MRKYFPICIALFLGFILRILPGVHHIIFPYDQARDVLVVKQMIEHRDPLLFGPVTDIPGVHHGPLFYYIIAPLYALGDWSPTLVVIFFIFFNLSAVFPLYWFVKRAFRNSYVAYAAVFLYSVSYEMISYSRWISNPSLAVPITVWFLYVSLFLSKKMCIFPLIFGMLFGCLVQSELVLVYLLIWCYVVLWNAKQSLLSWVMFHIGAGIGVFPILFAQLKFGFPAFYGILQHVAERQSHIDVWSVFGLIFMRYVNIMGGIIKNNTYAVPAIFACIIMVYSIVYVLRYEQEKEKKTTFLLLFMFLLPISIFLSGVLPEKFFFAGVGVPCIVLCVRGLSLLYSNEMKKLAIFVYCFLIFGQLLLWGSGIYANTSYVQIQKDVFWDQRMQVIKSIYEEIDRIKPNADWSVSIFETPYGIRTAWAYYFSYYSNINRKPMPVWYGYAANGYLGDELLPKVDAPKNIHVTIYEPSFDIAPQFKEEFTKYQDEHTTLQRVFFIHGHEIQIRMSKTF